MKMIMINERLHYVICIERWATAMEGSFGILKELYEKGQGQDERTEIDL